MTILLFREILKPIVFTWTHVFSSTSFCITAAAIQTLDSLSHVWISDIFPNYGLRYTSINPTALLDYVMGISNLTCPTLSSFLIYHLPHILAHFPHSTAWPLSATGITVYLLTPRGQNKIVFPVIYSVFLISSSNPLVLSISSIF